MNSVGRSVGVVAVASLLLVGCSKASPPGTGGGKPATGLRASINVTAATLADDCGQGAPAAQEPAATMATPAPAAAIAASCPQGVDCSFRAPCQQSSVQLDLTAVGTGTPAPVAVTDIELLDKAGASLGHMTGRAPQVWIDNAYTTWDAQLRPGERLRLSVPASAPPWDKIAGGRWGGGMFQVRVTVTVGGVPYSATSTASIAPEPMVVT